MFHLLLPCLALATHHTHHAADQDTLIAKLQVVVERQSRLMEGLERTVTNQAGDIERLKSDEHEQEVELKVLRHKVRTLQRRIDELQWDTIHASVSAACSHLKPTMTKTVLPFVEEVSCAAVCAASNTRFTTCVAMIRFNTLKHGRMQEVEPFSEVWVRTDACKSSSYALGTELLKENTSGYYTACCCGF
jgi:uncharacterized coiled-coil protein SlyX